MVNRREFVVAMTTFIHDVIDSHPCWATCCLLLVWREP